MSRRSDAAADRAVEQARRLERLAETHGPAVIAYLARRCVVREDAADLYQRVLTTTWRRLGDVPAADQAALCWLLAVARRELANARRGERRRTAATQALRQALTVRAADRAPAPDPGLHEALADLSADDREILLLTYWDGLSSDEASAVLGIRAAAARKRLQRARERLAGHPGLAVLAPARPSIPANLPDGLGRTPAEGVRPGCAPSAGGVRSSGH